MLDGKIVILCLVIGKDTDELTKIFTSGTKVLYNDPERMIVTEQIDFRFTSDVENALVLMQSPGLDAIIVSTTFAKPGDTEEVLGHKHYRLDVQTFVYKGDELADHPIVAQSGAHILSSEMSSKDIFDAVTGVASEA